MTKQCPNEFVTTIRDFVAHNTTVEQFEERYLDMFKSYTGPLDDVIFRILDALFCDVDAYYPDPDIRDPEIGIDEAQLYQRCKETLQKLEILGD